MNMDHHHIDKLFKNGLHGYKPKTPAGAWSRLNSGLYATQKKKTLVLIRWAAASLLIFLAFGAGYFYATLNIPSSSITQSEKPANLQSNKASAGTQTNSGRLANTKNESNSDSTAATGTVMNNHNHLQQNQNNPYNQQIVANQPPEIIISKSATPSNDPGQTHILVYKQVEPVFAGFLNSEIETDDIVYPAEPTTAQSIAGKTLEMPLQIINPDDYYEAPADSRMLKWTLGAQFAPTYSYREISTNYSVGSAASDVDNYNNSEASLLSYAGGLNVGYAVNQRWSLNSGIYFSRIGQVSSDALEFTEDKGELVLSGIYTSSGLIDFSADNLPANIRKVNPPKDSISDIDPLSVKIIQNFDLFEVPLMMKYALLNKKLSINLSGGLSPAYLVRNRNYLEFESNRYDIGGTANLNSFILNSSIGLGFGYQLSNKLSLNFEPTFKYSLSPINSDSKVYYHPYYLSWFTGINYRF